MEQLDHNWMKSDEGANFIRNFFEDVEKIKSHQFQRIEKYFNSLNSSQLDDWIPKILNWEEKYEKFWYAKGIQTESNIFSILIEVLRKYGSEHDVDDYDEDFLSDVFTWGDFTFKMYNGQGCFRKIHLTKGLDKDLSSNIIFQSI